MHGPLYDSWDKHMAMCLSQLSRSWGTGSDKNLIAQLVSRLSLCEIMVQERTNIGQLISELWFRENHGDFTGTSIGNFIVFAKFDTAMLETVNLGQKWRKNNVNRKLCKNKTIKMVMKWSNSYVTCFHSE